MEGTSPMSNNNETNRLSKVEQDNIDLMKRYFKEIWNDRRIETIQEIFSPDFVVHYEHTEIKGIRSWK